MASQFKLSVKRGQRAQDVVRANGTTISGSDAIEVNVDVTNMTKLDFVTLLGAIKQQVLAKGWPQ